MKFRDREIAGRGESVCGASRRLSKSTDQLSAFFPLGDGSQHIDPDDRKRATRIMSVLNITPDSFSDGGDNQAADTEALRVTIRGQIAAGATMIDVGGQSSRPNAPNVTAEEELSRILPAIEAIKSLPEASGVVISVDTYRAAVAQAAIEAGAHVINDISAGQLDPDMLPTIARLGCTYIMMHMRGTPADMMSEENCKYPGGLIKDVASELNRQAAKAMELGVRRWRIILDPGVGFSKTAEQNVQILRGLPDLRNRCRNFPWLVGTSRKSFIGKLTGVEDPKQRVWGTAATMTAAVMGGADIVRVHDVKEMADVVKMADAMYRV